MKQIHKQAILIACIIISFTSLSQAIEECLYSKEEFPSDYIFISYRGVDYEDLTELRNDFTGKGYAFWDYNDSGCGDRCFDSENVGDIILNSSVALVAWSSDYITSPYCLDELQMIETMDECCELKVLDLCLDKTKTNDCDNLEEIYSELMNIFN